MPTEPEATTPAGDVPMAAAAPIEQAERALEARARERRALRLGIGVTISFLVALGLNWSLAYLAPVFTAPLLQARAGPSLRSAIGILLVTFVIMLACLLASGLAQTFPAFFVVVLFLALYWTFRYGLRGGSGLVMLLILIGLMLLPMVAETTAQITQRYAASFLWNIGLSLAVAFVMFALIPPARGEPAPAPKPVLSATEINRRAGVLTALTGSYLVLYFAYGWTNVHTPLYIAVYAFSASLARGRMVAGGILLANIAAGLLTVAMYQLTLMTPFYPFVAAMTLTVALILARLITSPARWASLAGFALSVVMILYGESIIPFGDAGGSSFGDRMGELGMAAIYAIAGLYVLETFFPAKASGAPAPVPPGKGDTPAENASAAG